jgi:hypothetical protein
VQFEEKYKSGRGDAVYVLFLKEKNQKNFLWVLICGFDMTRSDIPFGSLDICVIIKSLTEQRQNRTFVLD